MGKALSGEMIACIQNLDRDRMSGAIEIAEQSGPKLLGASGLSARNQRDRQCVDLGVVTPSHAYMNIYAGVQKQLENDRCLSLYPAMVSTSEGKRLSTNRSSCTLTLALSMSIPTKFPASS
jgi:hypothetical protein